MKDARRKCESNSFIITRIDPGCKEISVNLQDWKTRSRPGIKKLFPGAVSILIFYMKDTTALGI